MVAGFEEAPKKKCFLAYVLYFGPSGCLEMILFSKKLKNKLFFRFFFRATYFTRMWAILQKEEDRKTVIDACRALEVTAMDIFAHNGWQFSKKLCGM